MTTSGGWLSIAATLLTMLAAHVASAQQMSSCVENSPERRGEIGCSIIESKVLPDGLKEPLWHIDRFDLAAQARGAVGPASVAFEAAGSSWLMTIEAQTSDHHGGRHVAEVGPLPLPRAAQYAMNVISSAFAPGMYSTAISIPVSKRFTSLKASNAWKRRHVVPCSGRGRRSPFRPAFRCDCW